MGGAERIRLADPAGIPATIHEGLEAGPGTLPTYEQHGVGMLAVEPGDGREVLVPVNAEAARYLRVAQLIDQECRPAKRCGGIADRGQGVTDIVLTVPE